MGKKMSPSAKAMLGVMLVIVCLLVTSLFITGCSNSEIENSTTVPQATADTTVSGQNATDNSTGNASITKEVAKETALSHAGLSGKNVQRFQSRLDWENGRQVYEIEFDFEGFEYDYEIDSKTGEILQFSKETR